jgi:P27 family predicted phage terminase small subunit
MLRGPKPKPAAVKLAEGNPGKRKINRQEPKFGETLTCPDWLTSSAKREWKRVSAELQALKLLQSVDRASLAAYCQSYSRWRSAELQVSKEGQILSTPIVTKDGEIVGYTHKRHPATTVAREERAAMLKAASLFGFDPSSRSRLTTGEAAEAEDPFAKFMQGLVGEDTPGDEEE